MSSKITKNIKTGASAHTLTPIAIIGMAGIFPEAQNLERYWENILDEVNCIREVPASRWNVNDYYDSDPLVPDKSYSKYGGFIPDIQFDPMEFGLPPNILEVTDVSQLLGLIVAKDALVDAGYRENDKEVFNRTGVILGMVGMSSKVIHPLLNRLQYPVWEKVLRSSSVPEEEVPAIIEKMKLAYIGWNENAFPGAIGNVVAGRIANRFDLGGTNCIVDAACGSSLAAVSMAVSELALGRADMMITGGVDTDNSILTFLCFSKTPAFSKGDRLRAFSAESDGMLTGEGIGMLVLKRLADAERDGDRIYAVIHGIGTSSDGYFKSIYAPRPSGQAKAIQRAYDCAGYSQNTVGLIEAHGTGTNAGDPAEFEGLRQVFSRDNPQKQHIALGSVKSQIGHTKAAAGAASLIKASLALHDKVLPATINISKPHPGMEIEQSPFYLNTRTRPWFRRTDGKPRRAGVSSFGFGGTNFHIAVEEYNDNKEFVRIHPSPYTILLSAPTLEELKKICQSATDDLVGEQAEKTLTQLDEASFDKGIPPKHSRVGFVAESVEDAREKLAESLKLLKANESQEHWSHPKGIFFRSSGIETSGKTVALFPGQGSQYVNMGLELAINFPEFRNAFEHADTQAAEMGGELLTSVVFPIPVFSDEECKTQQEKLTATENAQPAIGTFSMGLYQMLESAGFHADFFAGHSFGELTALWASSMLDDDAYLRLAFARGLAMSTPAASGKDTGSMAAVKGNVSQIRDLIKVFPEVKIANFNSTSQVVLAGSTKGIKDVQPVLESADLSVYPLNVSAAFHTKFVEHAKEPFSKAIKKEKFHQTKDKVYSNTTAQPYSVDAAAAAQTLSDHILNPVRFQEEIENIYNNGGRIFIEIGPKNVLSNLVKDILGEKPHEIVTFNPNTKGDSDLQFRQAVLQLRMLGFEFGNIDPHKSHKTIKTQSASKVAVMLNGGLYTTDASKLKFDQALKEGSSHRMLKVSTANSRSIVNNLGRIEPAPVSQPNNLIPTTNLPKVTSVISCNEIENLIQKLQAHQSGLLKTHEQFLQNDNTSKALLQQITDTELSMLSSNNGNQPDEHALNVIEKWAETIASQHEATSNAHQVYIQSQTDFTRRYTELILGLMNDVTSLQPTAQPAESNEIVNEMIIDDPVETSVPATIAPVEPSYASSEPAIQAKRAYLVDELSASFLTIVSEKTGYPVDMLELDMDMEADLGIDSIKRVEILGAMQEQYPALPTIEAEELVELRTLSQVIGAFKVDATASPAPVSAKESTAVEDSSTAVTIDLDVSSDEIKEAFLEIVSEKTGYPMDMLELSMDMEADLGIDSIKRVEILGTIQEKYPKLPTISAEELVELRTLAQVISAFKNGSSTLEEPQVIQPTQASQAVKDVASQASENQTDEIKSSFLEIVGEKTGYPTDMLELKMDMEADLGIDSIKRVEILGAVQEKYPDLPSISAEELVELRTLGQIIAKFNAGEKTEVNSASMVSKELKPAITTPIAVMRVTLQPLPRPDHVVFDFPEGSTVLITAKDSEKANHLAKSFIDKGLNVGLIYLTPNVKPANSAKTKGIIDYTLEETSDDAIQVLMQHVITDHKKIVAFFHLESARNGKNNKTIDISNKGEQSLKSVFLIARHLKAPLSEAPEETRPAFITVTQMDGQFGLKGYKAADPQPGGFAGLVKTLRQEWPNVFCRALDFHPEIDAQEMAEKIQDELHDADLRLGEVGYTPEGRFTLALSEER